MGPNYYGRDRSIFFSNLLYVVFSILQNIFPHKRLTCLPQFSNEGHWTFYCSPNHKTLINWSEGQSHSWPLSAFNLHVTVPPPTWNSSLLNPQSISPQSPSSPIFKSLLTPSFWILDGWCIIPVWTYIPGSFKNEATIDSWGCGVEELRWIRGTAAHSPSPTRFEFAENIRRFQALRVHMRGVTTSIGQQQLIMSFCMVWSCRNIRLYL